MLLLLVAVGYGYSRSQSTTDSATPNGTANQDGSGGQNGTGASGQAAPQEPIDLTAAINASLTLSGEEKSAVEGSETNTSVIEETDPEINAYSTVYAQQELN